MSQTLAQNHETLSKMQTRRLHLNKTSKPDFYPLFGVKELAIY